VGIQGDPRTTTISHLLCVPIWFLIIPDMSTSVVWRLLAKTSSSKAGETWQENCHWILLMKYLFHTSRVL
jgi:hypothetical protein